MAIQVGGGDGLKTALALAAGEPPELQEDLFADAVAPAVQAPAVSGPRGGRPKGARNKSTEQWRQYLLGKYASPLETLLALTMRTPAELARELGLYKYSDGKPVVDEYGRQVLATGEAAKILVDAATAALPYLHQKQPMALEVAEKKVGVLVVHTHHDGQSDDGIVFAGQVQENQQVIDVAPGQSHEAASDAT